MAALGAYITALAGLGGLAKKVAEKQRNNSGTTTNSTSTETTPTASAGTTPSKTSTFVYSPTGTVQQGYIQGDKTYLNDGTRISDGYSSIDSSGNVWTLENGAGVKKGNINEGYNPASTANAAYQTQLEQQAAYENQLKQLQAKEEAAAEAQAEAQRQQIAANKQSINDSYDSSAREAYITSMQNQKALPALMSTQGMTGGATESSMLNLQTNYENNLADLENARNTALANADLGLNDVNADLASTLASINSQYGAKLADYVKDKQDEAKSDYITNISQYYDDYQAEINRLLASGVPESDYRIQYLRAARQSKIKEQQEEAAAQAAALAAAQAKSSSSGSRSSSGGGTSSSYDYDYDDEDSTVSTSGNSSSNSDSSSGSSNSGKIADVTSLEVENQLKALSKADNAASRTIMRNYLQKALESGIISTARAKALINKYGL